MAQRRRRKRLQKRKQRLEIIFVTALCVVVALASLTICLIMIDPFSPKTTQGEQSAAAQSFDPNAPFTVSDLTSAQLTTLQRDARMHVSDGPRGISIGDTLDEVLSVYPSTFTDKQDEEQTGMQSDEEIILYCETYFENRSGHMTALPPRGLLSVDAGSIVVTLLAPMTPYPEGTLDDYGRYEHVYCRYTVEPDTMTVSQIVLGID